MFEYLPDVIAEENDDDIQDIDDIKIKSNVKKPLAVRLIIFRLVLAAAAAAVLAYISSEFPESADRTEKDFDAAVRTDTEADKAINDAAAAFSAFIGNTPAENRSRHDRA